MRTVFSGGRIFDGTGAAIAEADVAVDDGYIAEVGPGLDGDEQVDVTGSTLLPGLIDTHVHVMFGHLDMWRHLQTPFSYMFYDAIRNLDATIRVGITSVRDAGGADLGVKRAVDEGIVRGPRLQISLTMLSQTGGHGDGWMVSGADLNLVYPGMPSQIVDGVEEARRKVREVIRAGADVIKIATSGGVLSPTDSPDQRGFAPDEIEAMCEEARAAGLFVMAHAQAAVGIKNAVRAGVRSIEHGIYIDDEALALMLEHGTFLVPTLVAPLGVLRAADEGVPIPDHVLVKATDVVEAHRDSIRRAAAAGVKIAMGTDAGVVPHGSNLEELQLMTEIGMSPTEALVATTKTAAELMGLERELGRSSRESAPTSSSSPAIRSTSPTSRAGSNASTRTASSSSMPSRSGWPKRSRRSKFVYFVITI
jgi:imidazolonepropionase-like amidohydrolase